MRAEPGGRERRRAGIFLDLAWIAGFAVVAVWVFHRLGAFDLWQTITLPDGTSERLVKTFGAVDHPFHAGRAELLRRSLADGEILRWVAAHQGGYPVEFYPLGAAAFEVLIWASTLGLLPVMAAHKVAVIVIFLLPVAGYFLLARADRIPLGVGLLALAFHLSARGWWWSGGYYELVDWGLVSSSLAMATLLLFVPVSFLALRQQSIRWAAVAAVVAAFAVYTNARSFLPLAAVAVGMISSLTWESDRRIVWRPSAVRAIGIIGVAALLAAPLLIAIARFNDLYYFVIYERYDSFREYWHASITAVSGPVFALAIVGFVAVWLLPNLVAGRFVALTLIAHVLMTVLLSGLTIGPHIEQLEAIRLMPFQRALTIYLAALGIYAVLATVARFAGRRKLEIVNIGLAGAILATFFVYIWWEGSPIPESDRAMYPVLTTGESFFLEQEEAIELADRSAEPGTAILVLGSMLSWHDQFWSMQWSDRPFFFNDWLWYWQQDLYGDYDPTREHVYPDPATTLDPEFLSVQGIGAVVVSSQFAGAASISSELEQIAQGVDYSVYLVRNPTAIVTAEGATTTEIDVQNQQIRATVSEPSANIQVRRNWFPRWSATIDGQPAMVLKDEHGFMTVLSSSPGTEIALVYRVDAWDWLGRMFLLMGIGIAAAFLLQPRRFEKHLGLRGPSRQGMIETASES
ncbi:MAG: hypothetical protein KC438_03385 [Thermomicrobiales bacterium]|nr:hypothetical protein [Thermomicrobiales bacterium]MCO5222538.1 hypothetical protein [Thermomicrobiales bacterium]